MMYWTNGKGVVYMNGGQEIGCEDAVKRACRGEYAGIEFSWTGVIPVDIFIDAQRKKSEIEKIIKSK